MTDKQCPLCGELNPDDETICWKCGSSLDHRESVDLNPEEHQTPAELVDAFRKFDLETGQNEEVEGPSNSFSEGETFSPEEDEFWLKRMRELSLGDAEDSEDFDEPDHMDISDENIPPWLKAVDPTRKQEPAAEADEEWGDMRFDTSSGEVSRFSIESTDDRQEEKYAEISDELSEDELPGWLTRLTRSHVSSAEEKEEPAQEEITPTSDNQDWLHDLIGAQGEAKEKTPDEESSILEGGQAIQDVGEQGEAEEDDAFIFSLFSEPEDSAGGMEGVPPSEEEIEPGAQGFEGFSDALTSAKTEEVAFSAEEKPAADGPVQDEDESAEQMIDWLAEDQPASEPSDTETGPASEAEADEALGETYPEFPLAVGEETQDWSQVMESLDITESAIEEELPNWMSLQNEIMGEEAEISPEQLPGGEFVVDEAEQEPSPEMESAFEATMDSSFAASEALDAAAEAEAATEDEKVPPEISPDEARTDMPFKGEDLLAWMHDLREEEIKKAEGEGSAEAPPSKKEGIPDWFEEEEAASQEASEKEEVLERGDLPTWLSAIRPIEAVIPEDIKQLDEKKVEQAGPLAGLRAVIPAQEDAIHYGKPPVYSVRLQVSEKQRAHAAMLEDILDAEGQAPAEKRKRKTKSQYILRLFIALVILAAAVLPYFDIAVGSIPLNAGASSRLQAFSTTIDSIPQGATVLLGVDFAPGYSGEMNVVAGGVLARLMSRGIHIAVISTTPTGPALAEGLMDQTLSKMPDYAAQYAQPDWYINLGYLPGETASLKEFAQQPRQAVIYGMKAGLSNALVWDTAGLNGINKISDFSAVILVTENLENGRAWIEQVQPMMNDVPLLAASSAQSAPLLQPYVQSGQIQAILAGLPEGLVYGQQTQPAGSQDLAWSSYQNALLISILVILVGALVAGVISMFTGSKSSQEV